MVQSHGHGSESGCLVETLIAPGWSSLSLYGSRPLWRVPRGFCKPQPLAWAPCMPFELVARASCANPWAPAFAVSCLAISSRPQKQQWMRDSGGLRKANAVLRTASSCSLVSRSFSLHLSDWVAGNSFRFTIKEIYVSVVKHRRCEAALSLCRLERRGLPRKIVEWHRTRNHTPRVTAGLKWPPEIWPPEIS